MADGGPGPKTCWWLGRAPLAPGVRCRRITVARAPQTATAPALAPAPQMAPGPAALAPRAAARSASHGNLPAAFSPVFDLELLELDGGRPGDADGLGFGHTRWSQLTLGPAGGGVTVSAVAARLHAVMRDGSLFTSQVGVVARGAARRGGGLGARRPLRRRSGRRGRAPPARPRHASGLRGGVGLDALAKQAALCRACGLVSAPWGRARAAVPARPRRRAHTERPRRPARL